IAGQRNAETNASPGVGGSDLECASPVSPELLAETSGFFQDVYRCWKRSLRRVAVRTPAPEPGSAAPARTEQGVFFSGGVDSLFSLVKRRDEVTDLITVHGFDIKLDEHKRWAETSDRLQQMADAFGKRFLPVRTNLREIVGPVAPSWGLYHGGALAAVGHALAGAVGRLYIGSTHTYADMFPWGSHPLLDPRWTGRSVSFVHDGAEATRVEKVQLVAQEPTALEHVRVCWRNAGDKYNCGACEKCVRTMINLSLVGKLNECPAFPKGALTTERVSKMMLMNDNDVSFAQENLDFAREHAPGHELIGALEAAIAGAGRMPIGERCRRGSYAVARAVLPRPVRQALRRVLS
ncbi:MAG: hypothetical protein AAGK04_04985, partial [Planctomycetota bacterium]